MWPSSRGAVIETSPSTSLRIHSLASRPPSSGRSEPFALIATGVSSTSQPRPYGERFTTPGSPVSAGFTAASVPSIGACTGMSRSPRRSRPSSSPALTRVPTGRMSIDSIGPMSPSAKSSTPATTHFDDARRAQVWRGCIRSRSGTSTPWTCVIASSDLVTKACTVLPIRIAGMTSTSPICMTAPKLAMSGTSASAPSVTPTIQR